jgi:hypothetical protein
MLRAVAVDRNPFGRVFAAVRVLLFAFAAASPFGCGITKDAGGGAGSNFGGGGLGGNPVGQVAGAGGGSATVIDGGPADAGADQASSSCSPNQMVEPISTIAVYEKQTCVGSTAGAACTIPGLMERLLACDAVSFTSTSQFGLAYDVLRVAERREHTCVIELWQDYEASETYWNCELPLPLAPWTGLLTTHGGSEAAGEALLNGIRDQCKVATCCTFVPYCSPMHCDPGFVHIGGC